MKYSSTLIKRIMAAIISHPFHTFWNVRIEYEFSDIETCCIRFCTLDDIMCEIQILSTEIHAVVNPNAEDPNRKWCGCISYRNQSYDQIMMWLGCKLNTLHEEASAFADAQ